jgi:hypothetical protein
LQPNANQSSTTLETGGLKTKQLATVVEQWFEPDLNQMATTIEAVIAGPDDAPTTRLENGCNQKATTLAGRNGE